MNPEENGMIDNEREDKVGVDELADWIRSNKPSLSTVIGYIAALFLLAFSAYRLFA